MALDQEGYYNPKYAFGKPSDQVADGLLAARLPLPVRRAMFKATLRATVGDLESFGAAKARPRLFETHPIVNQQLVYYVGHGDITPKPDVDHFDAAGVVFEDGSAADVDLVIFATGYLAVFPFCRSRCPDNADGRPGWACRWHARIPQRLLRARSNPIPASGRLRTGRAGPSPPSGPARARPPAGGQAHRKVLSERDQSTRGAEYKDSTRHYYDRPTRTTCRRCSSSWIDLPASRSPRVLRRWDWSNPPKDVHPRCCQPCRSKRATPERMERPPLLFVPWPQPRRLVLRRTLARCGGRAGFPLTRCPCAATADQGVNADSRGRSCVTTSTTSWRSSRVCPRPPVIVGHSLGALVVQRAVPVPTRAAVLLTPIPTGGIGPSLLSGHAAPAGSSPRGHRRQSRLTADDLSGVAQREARDYADRLGRESPWAQYAMLRPEPAPPVSAPVLVMGPKTTGAGSIRRVELRSILRCTGRSVPGGHDVMLDGGWEFALDTLLDWVDRTVPARRTRAATVPAPLRSDLSVGWRVTSTAPVDVVACLRGLRRRRPC